MRISGSGTGGLWDGLVKVKVVGGASSPSLSSSSMVGPGVL